MQASTNWSLLISWGTRQCPRLQRAPAAETHLLDTSRTAERGAQQQGGQRAVTAHQADTTCSRCSGLRGSGLTVHPRLRRWAHRQDTVQLQEAACCLLHHPRRCKLQREQEGLHHLLADAECHTSGGGQAQTCQAGRLAPRWHPHRLTLAQEGSCLQQGGGGTIAKDSH